MSAGRVLANRYELTEVIDQGGMGDLFKGHDRLTQTPVAVKALKPEVVADDPSLLRRFEREAAVLARLNHPNIVRVLDTFSEGSRHYIVMEYIGGGSLARLLLDTAPLPVERILKIALDLSDALVRTHHLNIIHRDLKPANVLLTEDGIPKLTDFGVARVEDAQTLVTQVGSILGTVAYLSPELCEGAPYDEAGDLWAFGVMLYEMLTGRHPFRQATTMATIGAILHEPIPDIQQFRPDTPLELRELVSRMLSKDPSRRVPSARAVGAALETILKQVRERPEANVTAPPVTPPPLPLPQWRRTLERQSTHPLVFLCYRRPESSENAARIHDRLVRAFGETHLLRDVDHIADRTISRFVLANDVVARSDVVVVVIGKTWMKGIGNPKDPVRLQLEAALKRPNILTIPLLVDGAAMPPEATLPPSLHALASKPAFTLSADSSFDGQVKRLINHIRVNTGGARRLPRASVLTALIAAVLLLVIVVGGALLLNGLN